MRPCHLMTVSISILLFSLGSAAVVEAEPGACRIAILDDDLPGWPRRLAREMETVLRARSLDARREGIEILLEKVRSLEIGSDRMLRPGPSVNVSAKESTEKFAS